MRIRSHRDLRVYRLAKSKAFEIFQLTKTFPVEERFSMTDQIRRSSRAVCTNIAEAWRKRRYRAAFVAKLSDAETEAEETRVWIEFAVDCGYMGEALANRLDGDYNHVLAQLVSMICNPEKWLLPERPNRPQRNSKASSPPHPLTPSPPQ